MEGARVLSHGVRWKVGSGSQVNITADDWVPGVSVRFKDSVPSDDLPSMVEQIIDPASHSWDSTRIRQVFPPPIADSILGMERLHEKMDDFVYWKFTRDGSFTTKSAYAHILTQDGLVRSLNSTIIPGWWKKFWGLLILPKWKIFVWKILHNGLPTAVVLVLKGVPVNATCGFCHQHPETISHIFQHCEFTGLVRSSHHLEVIRTLALDRDFSTWFADLISSFVATKNWHGLDEILAFFWAMWLTRNNL